MRVPCPMALPHTRAISVMCTYSRCLINICCMNKLLPISEANWGLFLNNKGAHKEYRFETGFECKLSICLQVSQFDLLQARRLQSKQAGQCIFSCRKGCKGGNEKKEVRLEFAFWLHGLPFNH